LSANGLVVGTTAVGDFCGSGDFGVGAMAVCKGGSGGLVVGATVVC
jgi:hypothetical protein